MENKVKFIDDNRTMVVATGFETENEATSAIDSFLAEQGEEYGRAANGSEQEGNWYFRVSVTEIDYFSKPSTPMKNVNRLTKKEIAERINKVDPFQSLLKKGITHYSNYSRAQLIQMYNDPIKP